MAITTDALNDLAERVRAVVAREYPEADIEVEARTEIGRVTGQIVSDVFAGMSPSERQARLWAILRDRFDPADLLRISLLFTLTPQEIEDLDSADFD